MMAQATVSIGQDMACLLLVKMQISINGVLKLICGSLLQTFKARKTRINGVS